jgi:co-chaperonin GroES (HSP10)
MTPLGGRVLLRRPPIPEQIGLIHIPERARMIPQEGVVVAVTRGVPCPACGHHQEPTVQVGDNVLHGRYSRMSVPGDGDDLYLVFEKDLMAVLDGEP